MKKNSFLTRLAEIASQKNADIAVADEYSNHPAIKDDNRRFVKVAVAATVGTAAVLALSWKTLSAMAPVETEIDSND